METEIKTWCDAMYVMAQVAAQISKKPTQTEDEEKAKTDVLMLLTAAISTAVRYERKATETRVSENIKTDKSAIGEANI